MYGDLVRRCEDDDGHYVPEIGPHSLEKIAIHNRYSELFSTAVSRGWARRAYVGLYAGAGRARVRTTGEVVETSALAVLRQRHHFTHHVFVDDDERCIEALRNRARSLGREDDCTFIHGDVNKVTAQVRQALPRYTREQGLLSLCFVDPFDIKLKFATIRALSSFRMDFLVLLMLGVDARRNFRRYHDDITSTVVADLIDCPDWRSQLESGRERNVLRFLKGKFDTAMASLGYQVPSEAAPLVVKPVGKNVSLYVLGFYSKSPLGLKLWGASRRSMKDQGELWE